MPTYTTPTQPIYLLINTSSANKENLDSWLNCIRLLVNTLRQSAYESMSIHLSLVGFDSSVNTLHPLTPISSFRIPEISCGDGQMWLGAALVGLKSLIVHDRIYHEDNYGYMRPKLFIFTDKDIVTSAILGLALGWGATGGYETIKQLTKKGE